LKFKEQPAFLRFPLYAFASDNTEDGETSCIIYVQELMTQNDPDGDLSQRESKSIILGSMFFQVYSLYVHYRPSQDVKTGIELSVNVNAPKGTFLGMDSTVTEGPNPFQVQQ
jgi:hypothetical protein